MIWHQIQVTWVAMAQISEGNVRGQYNTKAMLLKYLYYYMYKLLPVKCCATKTLAMIY